MQLFAKLAGTRFDGGVRQRRDFGLEPCDGGERGVERAQLELNGGALKMREALPPAGAIAHGTVGARDLWHGDTP